MGMLPEIFNHRVAFPTGGGHFDTWRDDKAVKGTGTKPVAKELSTAPPERSWNTFIRLLEGKQP